MNKIIKPYEVDKNQNLESQLEEVTTLLHKREQEIEALIQSSKEILAQKGFKEEARAIFNHCRNLTGATSGYVALLDEIGQENEVLFLESGGLPCTVDPELPMPIRGLRAEAYKRGETVYDNDFMASEWVEFMPQGHVILRNVMFAPLIIENKTVGIMGLANKNGDFDHEDARIASELGELAAIALQNSWNIDKKHEAEEQKNNVIVALKKAIEEVKKLSGLLPICSHCKKIRDDKGYWNEIESYLEENSEAELTHSICKSCSDTLYPDMDLYPDDK